MRLSDRVTRVRQSGTIAVKDRVSQLKRAGREVLNLGIGDPDFDVPTEIKEGISRALDENLTHYTASSGIQPLREQISSQVRDTNGLDYSADEVVVTVGAKEGIFCAVMALVEDGQGVIVPTPTWVSHPSIVQLAGGRAQTVKTVLEDDFQPSVEDIQEEIRDDTRAVILNNPNNPTGAVYSEEFLRATADLAVDHDLVVVADEIYDRFVFEGEHLSIGSMDGMRDRTITVNAFSKAYAMTGLRLGYAVGPTEAIKGMSKVHQHVVSNAPSIVQHGALSASSLTGEVEARRETFDERRRSVVRTLRDTPGLDFSVPQGAFYVFPRYDLEMDAVEFCTTLLEEKSVAVTPGDAFAEGGEGHFRIAYTRPLEELRESVSRIKEYLEEKTST